MLGRTGRERRSHGDLLEQASAAAVQLSAAGVAPGDRVGVVAAPSWALVAGLLGSWRCGAAVVMLAPLTRLGSQSSWRSQVEGQLEHAGARLVVMSGQGALLGGFPVLDPAPNVPGDPPSLPADPEQVALITYTSGSTAAPRGVVTSHRVLAERAASQLEGHGGMEPGTHHRLGWMPLHQWTLFADLLCPMAWGIDSTLLPTALFLADPLVWLSEISRVQATHSVGPNFSYGLVARHLEREPPEGVDLSSWIVAECGGEAINHETLERFARAAAPLGFDANALRPTYGLTETSRVTARPPRTGLRVDRVDRTALAGGAAVPAEGPAAAAFTSLGVPQPGVEVRIVGPEGASCTERQVGEIVVAGPVMTGYLDEPDATASVMRDGWFQTGDLGYIADGELFITGRSKDVIILNGRNYYAQDIERIAATIDGVGASCAAIGVRGETTEALVVVVESDFSTRESDERLRARIQERIWRRAGITPAAIVILDPGELPTTAAGKPMRSRVRQRYESGGFSRAGRRPDA